MPSVPRHMRKGTSATASRAAHNNANAAPVRRRIRQGSGAGKQACVPQIGKEGVQIGAQLRLGRIELRP